MRAPPMKPEKNARTILKYTQSIAKMVEFDVSKEEQEQIHYPSDPEELFTLVVGILGDISEEIIELSKKTLPICYAEDDAIFCANFFDSYKNTCRLHELDSYSLLIGAAAYYLANLPGSSNVLLDVLNRLLEQENNLSGFEVLLLEILQNDYSQKSADESIYAQYFHGVISSLKNFFDSGEKESEVLDNCSRLQDSVYKSGSPRDLFICDLCYAICIKKIDNSCWKNLPFFSELEKRVWAPTITKKNFVKELWPSQILLGQKGVYKGKSAVIQLPTSAGKTKSTELIIRSAFLSERTNIAVVIAPFKALCHEIKSDYLKCFKFEKQIQIDELNDAYDSSDSLIFNSEAKHVLVMTPEKLYYLLRINKDIVNQVGLLICDEGHQFDSSERGITYELLLTELKTLLPPHAQIVLISAVIHNATEISNWFSSECEVVNGQKMLPTQRSIAYIKMNRYIPQTQVDDVGLNNPNVGKAQFVDDGDLNKVSFFAPTIVHADVISQRRYKGSIKEKTFPEYDEKNKTYDSKSIALYLALKLSQKNAVAIFLAQKASLRPLLEKSLDYFIMVPKSPKPPCNLIEREKISALIRNNLGTDSIVYKASNLGIFSHIADIPHGVKLCIEDSAHRGDINLIVCTSTLAQGVNLPIKYLIIPSVQQNEDKIKTRDFHNLMGRIARAGKLTEGSVIFTNPSLENQSKRNEMNLLLNPDNSEDCKSSLLEFFEKITVKYRNVRGWLREYDVHLDMKSIVNDYYFGKKISDFSIGINQSAPEVPIDSIEVVFKRVFQCIEQIENFLMFFGKELKEVNVSEIAQRTFAYHHIINQQLIAQRNGDIVAFMDFEKIKNDFFGVFEIVKQNIINSISDEMKLSVYSKSMRGLKNCKEIELFLDRHYEEIVICDQNDVKKFFDIVLPLFSAENIRHKLFCRYPDKMKMVKAIERWLCGNTFSFIYDILKNEKVGRGYITVEQCVDIFENGVAFDGSILVNVLSELILARIGDDNLFSDKMHLFQKQLKYGLPNKTSVYAYELGFCDRTIAQELVGAMGEASSSDELRANMIMHEDKMRILLQGYPSYFTKVYNQILDALR